MPIIPRFSLSINSKIKVNTSAIYTWEKTSPGSMKNNIEDSVAPQINSPKVRNLRSLGLKNPLFYTNFYRNLSLRQNVEHLSGNVEREKKGYGEQDELNEKAAAELSSGIVRDRGEELVVIFGGGFREPLLSSLMLQPSPLLMENVMG